MLEHIPDWLGHALANVRAGSERLVIATAPIGKAMKIGMTSLAFTDGGRIPERFTADGEGISPPISWGTLPEGTASLALIVEDADAPAPRPLVHAIIARIDPASDGLAEGAIRPDGEGGAEGDTGRNSFGREGWLPPDPPAGHGLHHYSFQLFALSEGPAIEANAGRGALVEALTGRVLGAGLLTGTYSRGEPADVGPVGRLAPA